MHVREAGVGSLVPALLPGAYQVLLRIEVVDRAMMNLNLGRGGVRGALAGQGEKMIPLPLTMIVTVALVPRCATTQECLGEAAETMTDSPAQ